MGKKPLARLIALALPTVLTLATLTFHGPATATPPPNSLWAADATFATGGVRTSALAAPTQTDTGRTVIDTHTDGRTLLISSNGFEAFRNDGSSDTSFMTAASGALTPPYPAYGLVDDLAYQSSGALVVLNADMLKRLTPAGALDASFGNRGSTMVPLGPLTNAHTRVYLDPTDRVVVVASVPLDAQTTSVRIVRFTSAGQLDTSFGSSGAVSFIAGEDPFEYIRSYPLPERQFLRGFFPDGGIIYSTGNQAVLRRISATGNLIAGSTYIQEQSWSPHQSFAWEVAGRADGSILAARTFALVTQPGGPSVAGPLIELQKILPSDTSPWGQMTSFPYLGTTFSVSRLDRDGNWLTLSGADPATGQPSFVRMRTDGENDREFGIARGTGQSACESIAVTSRSVWCTARQASSLTVQKLVGPAPIADYVAIQPRRLHDTRSQYANDDGALGTGAQPAGSILRVKVTGRGGIPADAGSVALNVTVTGPQAAGHLTVFPCQETPPNTSNVNYTVGQTVANLVVVPPDLAGNVCIFTVAQTEIIIDAFGYHTATSDFTSELRRVLDTRPNGITASGLFAGRRYDGTPGPLPANQRVEAFSLETAGRPVLLNITVVSPREAGWVRVFPCVGPEPETSNVNFVASQTVANLALTSFPIFTNPRIAPPQTVFCIRSSAGAHVVVDLLGSYDMGSNVHTIDASRLRDTRSLPTIDGLEQNTGPLKAQSFTSVVVAGRAGIPMDAGLVALNVTVTNPIAAGHLTVYPCGTQRPATSNINFVAGQTVANMVMIPIGTAGTVCVYSPTGTDLVIDAVAWLS